LFVKIALQNSKSKTIGKEKYLISLLEVKILISSIKLEDTFVLLVILKNLVKSGVLIGKK